MCLRVYFLIRTIMNFSVYAELYAKRVCVKHGFEQDTSFCLKSQVTKSPGKTIVIISVISITWLAYLLRVFEK